MSVLVEDNLISTIAASIPAPEGATVIDAGGRVLMPGLIDAHWHVTYAYTPASILLLNTGDMPEVAIRSMTGVMETLLRGFTTVRDPGGNPFAIKKLIDSGEYPGHRILPSGPFMSPTAGHADHYEVPMDTPRDKSYLNYWEREMIDPDFRRSGLIKAESIMAQLCQERSCERFADLSVPLSVVATDFWRRTAVVLESGQRRCCSDADRRRHPVGRELPDRDRRSIGEIGHISGDHRLAEITTGMHRIDRRRRGERRHQGEEAGQQESGGKNRLFSKHLEFSLRCGSRWIRPRAPRNRDRSPRVSRQ